MAEEVENIVGIGGDVVGGLYSMVDIAIPEGFLPDDVRYNFQSENYSLININLNLPMEGGYYQGYIKSN